MPAPDRIEILSVCLIYEDVFHMPNIYNCKSLSWICERCNNYTLKLLLKSTMGGGGDAVAVAVAVDTWHMEYIFTYETNRIYFNSIWGWHSDQSQWVWWFCWISGCGMFGKYGVRIKMQSIWPCLDLENAVCSSGQQVTCMYT